jgi:L-lactate dehydrogenase complex protein LldG
MSGAREEILGKIRRSLRRDRLDSATEAMLRARIAAHRRNPVPARATALDDTARIDLFVTMAREAQATVTRVAVPAAVPAAVADYLAAENLPAVIVLAPDPSLDAIPWATRPLLRICRGGMLAANEAINGPADLAANATTVTPAFAAIAETGTLLLISGPETPTTLNFLPDTHIVILRAEQIVAAYEDGWDRLRAARALPKDLPRVVNFITGPSRTADIEQQIVQGMHGPRRLNIVLVERGASAGYAEPAG